MKKHLWIVGDFGSSTDVEKGTPFQSRRDEVLRKVLLEAVGAEASALRFDVVFQDRTRNEWEKTPPAKPDVEIELNALTLHKRIQDDEPRCIVAVGGLAMEVLTGTKAEKLKDFRGKILPYIKDSRIKVVPVYESYFVERVKAQLNAYANDLLRAWNIAIDKTSGTGKTRAVLVDTMDKVNELIRHIFETGECCFDFETSDADTLHNEGFQATMLAISFQPGSAWVIPLEHKESPFTDREVFEIMAKLKEHVFHNAGVRKTAHNLKYDLKVAWRVFGISGLKGRLDDTMLMKHLFDDQTRNGLKDLVAQYFPDFDGYDEEVQRYKWDEVPYNVLVEYAAIDADMTLRLRTFLEERLIEDGKLYTLYRNLSMALLPVLTDIEMRGVLIDRKKLLKNITRAEELIRAKELKMLQYKEVKRYARMVKDRAKDKEMGKITEQLAKCKPLKGGGEGAREKTLKERLAALKTGKAEVEVGEMNFGSPVQLGELLYTKEGFGLKEPWDDAKRDYGRKTDKDTLVRFDDSTGFITDLLTHRSLVKTKGTYLVGVLERMDKDDMLHTEYLQHGTATGRLSSRNPNLQNIPDPGRVKWEEAKEVSAYVKGVFIAPEGITMLQVDYSQAELRLMAMYAQEDTMLEAYANGEDIHALTAAKLNGMTLEEFKALEPGKMKTLRYHAKAGNFGLIYGMSAEGFKEYAENDYGIKMTLEEATRIRTTFFSTYPGIIDYHDTYIAKAEKFGYVRTFLGRRRHTPEIANPNEYIRAQDQRIAVNTPIQGAAAELTLLAIVMLRQRLDPRVRMMNTVHDSIFFYCPDNLVDDSVRIIRSTCTALPTELYFGRKIEGVTMAVDVEATKENWKQMAALPAATA